MSNDGFALFRLIRSATSIELAINDLARAAEERVSGDLPSPQLLSINIDCGLITFACGERAMAMDANREWPSSQRFKTAVLRPVEA